ncbi:late histone H1 [Pseudescherichia vulneris]
MKKLAMMLGACTLLVWSVANAADGQGVAKAKSACQENPTQCSQAKSTAKADAQKEAQAAKNACAKNQSACDNAKAKTKNAVKQ